MIKWLIVIFLSCAAIASCSHISKADSEKAQSIQIQVTITGVPPKMARLLKNQLSLVLYTQYAKERPNKIYLLYRRGQNELTQALNNLSYFEPTVHSNIHQERQQNKWIIDYHVNLGRQLHIIHLLVRLQGQGNNNKALRQVIEHAPLKEGGVFDIEQYDRFKAHLLGQARIHGFFNPSFTEHLVTVDLLNHTANIRLVMKTGPQYIFGKLSFVQNILSNKFLHQYATFEPGESFNQTKLFTLQSDLLKSGYFANAVIHQDDNAKTLRSDININLTPVKPQEYLLGIGYGTDTGPRALLGWNYRYINRGGDHISLQIQASKKFTSFFANYIIPGEHPNTDFTSLNLRRSYINITPYKSEDTNVGVDVTKQLGQLTVSPGLHNFTSLSTPQGQEQRYDYYLMPQLGLHYQWSIPKQHWPLGYGITSISSFAKANELSTATFARSTLDLRLSLPVSENNRIYTRLFAGEVWTDNINNLAPSLRFYSGGTSSLLGFAYKTISPKDGKGNLLGATKTLFGSLNLEHMLFSEISVIAFYQAGNSFNQIHPLVLYQDVGTGLSWQSPVGPLTINVARPIDYPTPSWTFSVSIGDFIS